MKLFYAFGSSSLLPHIVLLEAGLPFTAIQIDEHTKDIEGGGDYTQTRLDMYRRSYSTTAPCSPKDQPSCSGLQIRFLQGTLHHLTAPLSAQSCRRAQFLLQRNAQGGIRTFVLQGYIGAIQGSIPTPA